MRIASLVPAATEALFALGFGDQVVAVTHECDHPAEALPLPRLTRSVLPPELEPGEVDSRVRELIGRGDALYDGLGPHRDTLAHVYDTLVADRLAMDRLRGYEGPMDPTHLRNELPAGVVEGMMDAVERHYPLAHRWFRVKAGILGLDRLELHDQYAPIGEARSVDYPEATRLIDALGELPRLRAVASRPDAVELLRWNDGSVLLRSEHGDAAERYFGAPQLDFFRPDLQRTLVDALPAGVLRLGSRVAGVEELRDEVEVVLAGGERMRVDGVVGDGCPRPSDEMDGRKYKRKAREQPGRQRQQHIEPSRRDSSSQLRYRDEGGSHHGEHSYRGPSALFEAAGKHERSV